MGRAKMPEEAGPLADALADMLSEVASPFESCQVSRDRPLGGFDWIAVGFPTLELSCSQPGTARFGILIDSPHSIHLFVGPRVYLREWYDEKNDVEAWVSEVRPLVEAVAEGRFVEEIWESGRGRYKGSSGTLYGADSSTLLTIVDTAPLFPSLLPSRRRTRIYSAYS